MPIVQPKTALFADMYISATPAIGLAATRRRRARCRSHDVDSTCRQNVVEALGVLLDEGAIVTAALEQVLGDAGEQRDVAADVRLDVEAGDPRCRTAGSADRTARGS